MGHSVRMIFMTQHGRVHYSEKALDQFVDLSKDADLICFSFLSDNFMRAARMTRYVRQRAPGQVIWGGVHASIEPEDSLNHVDILCRGEGEGALTELVQRMAEGRPFSDVKNLWVKTPSGINRNEMRPLLQDLDSNPWPDYSMEDHFIRDEDDLIKPMSHELLLKYHNVAPLGFVHYPVLSARGCAYHCSYCYNAAFKEIFKGQRRLRFRSLKNVVDEIRFNLDRYPFLNSFNFGDDDFFLRPMSQLIELRDLIQTHLPETITHSFWGCCVTPHSFDKKKLALLKPVGLRALVMGVQTGSERLNKEVYARNFKNDLLYKNAAVLDEEFHKEVIVMLDFLACGPYETEQDTAQTVEMMLKLPNWFVFSVYKYTFYPGSPLYRRALEDGLIPPGAEAYDAKQFMVAFNKGFNYITHILIFLSCAKCLIPKWIFKVLSSRLFRFLGRLIPQWLLDIIPWEGLYFRLWGKNQAAIYKGREIKHI